MRSWHSVGTVLALAFSCFVVRGARAATDPAYKDPRRSPDERAKDLLGRLTFDEKLVLLSGKGFESRGIPRLQIPELKMTDGPNGVRWGKTATAFPVAIAAAATFDEALIERFGAALALDVKAKGRNVILAPCVNISRIPQNGRNFECFGEDPFLAARAAVAYIKGVQNQGVIATVKHFACNNQEHRRRDINAVVDERALHEIYFPAFEASVKEAEVWTVMAAYNKVNGLFATESPHLLTDVLKTQWGFRGFVMSDWDAVQHTTPPVLAGLDMEMPEGIQTGEKKLAPEVKSGRVPQALIDDKVRRILWVMFKSGVFDRPAREDARAVAGPTQVQAALDLARGSMVLLKNDRAALPLGAPVKTLAVIGPGAVFPRLAGGGSGYVRPATAVKPLDAITTLAREAGIDVVHASGYSGAGDVVPIEASAFSHVTADGTVRPGLRAEYFANEKLEGKPVLTRIETEVDMEWSNESPGPGVPPDHFSARLTGRLTPPKPGRYRFSAFVNNGARLSIDGKLLVDAWENRDPLTSSAETELSAGPHDVVIEHHEGKGTATLRFDWALVAGSEADAVAAARKADAAVVFAGTSAFTEREAEDHDIVLPPEQERLIKAVARVNRRTIVVLNNGSPLVTERWIGSVPAVLEAWFPGQEGGTAIAEVLFGKTDPAGRLPFTFLTDWKKAPAFSTYPELNGEAPYKEGIFVGYRHYDRKRLPVRFAFGHGLSFARFKYQDLLVVKDAAGAWTASFTVTNTSKRAGTAVPQLYVGEVKPTVPRPVRELKGFTKLTLGAGESRPVTMTVRPERVGHFEPKTRTWVTNPGKYRVAIGNSSRDLQLEATVEHTTGAQGG
jgi:beta-glucosidase